jgi:hypothetical protein
MSIVFLCFGLAAETLGAQDAPWDLYPQALGGYYGPFSGSGLHYQRWSGDSGFHASGGIVYVPFNESDWWIADNTLDYSLGGEYQRRVYGESFTNWLAGSLFVFAGVQHRGFIPVELVAEGYYRDPDDTTTWEEPVFAAGSYEAEVTIGAGIGIELVLFRHVSWPLEFGYGATWRPTESALVDAFTVGPNVQTGFRYRF